MKEYKSFDTCLSWWRHQMEIFSALLAICVGNFLVPGEFPALKVRPVTRSFDVFLDLRPKKSGWVNNRKAGDLRRLRAHYGVIVMWPINSAVVRCIGSTSVVSYSCCLFATHTTCCANCITSGYVLHYWNCLHRRQLSRILIKIEDMICWRLGLVSSPWRHTSGMMSNHRQLDCLFKCFGRLISKKTPQVHITDPLWRESTGRRCIPPKRVSNVEGMTP